jgi:regulator of cell morphogenesis and NO signaling
MDIFVEQTKMAAIIRSNFNLLPVINRFGISLGFKDKTVVQICEEQKINTEFFLAIINTFNNESYFPEDKFLAFSPLLIVDYLKKTHHYYSHYFLPKIENQLDAMLSGDKEKNAELEMIGSFYKKYKNELMLHISDEEENVFPYVIKLVNEQKLNTNNYEIHRFEKEHLNVETKLNDLKNLIIKYIKPTYNENDCNEFLILLNRFELDIKDHARIEDNILVPIVKKIEEELA